MPPAGIKHGIVIARLMAYLGIHIQQYKLGELMDGQTGFRLSVEDCLSPDVSFVSRERLKLLQPVSENYSMARPISRLKCFLPAIPSPRPNAKSPSI